MKYPARQEPTNISAGPHPCHPSAPVVAPVTQPLVVVPPHGHELLATIHDHSKNCYSSSRCVQNLVDNKTCYLDDPVNMEERRLDALWHVSDSGEIWVEFDLQEVKGVQTVVLYGQDEQANCGRDIISFKLLYQDAAGTYLLALDVNNTYADPSAGPCSCQQSTEEECPNPTVRTHFVPGNAQARYWKLILTQPYYADAKLFGLMEVKFFGLTVEPEIYPVQLRNYSLNCVSDERCAPNLIDGQTCFQPQFSNALWAIEALGHAWVAFDLLSPFRVSSISLFGSNEKAHCESEVNGFELFYEKEEWYRALAVESTGICRKVKEPLCPNLAESMHVVPGGIVAQLWKILITGAFPESKFFGLMEVKFHGKQVLDPEILPVSVTDDSKNCVSDHRCASNLVDGNTCFDSQAPNDAFWTVRHLRWAWIIFDLQKPHKVTTLVTYGQNGQPHCAMDATGYDLRYEHQGKYYTAMSVTDVHRDVTSGVKQCQQLLACECPNPNMHYSFITGGFVSRFWKLSITGAYRNATYGARAFGLMEVKFLGTPEAEDEASKKLAVESDAAV